VLEWEQESYARADEASGVFRRDAAVHCRFHLSGICDSDSVRTFSGSAVQMEFGKSVDEQRVSHYSKFQFRVQFGCNVPSRKHSFFYVIVVIFVTTA